MLATAHAAPAAASRLPPADSGRALSSLLTPHAKVVSTNLVAFLAYIAGQIASTSTRARGRHVGDLVHGDLADHTNWDAGIKSALRFMKDRTKCPTRCALVSAIQKKKKRT